MLINNICIRIYCNRKYIATENILQQNISTIYICTMLMETRLSIMTYYHDLRDWY